MAGNEMHTLMVSGQFAWNQPAYLTGCLLRTAIRGVPPCLSQIVLLAVVLLRLRRPIHAKPNGYLRFAALATKPDEISGPDDIFIGDDSGHHAAGGGIHSRITQELDVPDSTVLLSLVFGSSLASSLFFVLSARILRGATGEDAPSAIGVVGVTHISAAIFLLPFLPAAGIVSLTEFRAMASFSVLILILLTAVLHFAARLLHFEALSLTDVSLVSPFAALTPVLTLFTAWIIIGERPSALEFIGILIVVVSLLGLTGATRVFRAHLRSRPTAEKGGANLGLWFAFLSTIPPAVKIAVQKKAILLSSPFTYALIMLFLTGTCALVICVFRFSKEDLRAQFPPQRLRSLFLISGLLALNTFLFCKALTLGMAAGISAMARISIVFQGILAYWLAGQKADFRTRILWAVAIFVGTLVIGFAGS
jgi:drug/metabolite transporter (DMT)-like permease